MSDEELRRAERAFRIQQDEYTAMRLAKAYIRSKMPPTEDELREDERLTLDRARSIIVRDYYDDVKGIAEDLLSKINSGEIKNPVDFDTAIHEKVDGSERVIYTSQAREAVLVSQNEDEGFESGMLDPSSWSDGVNWSQWAYCCLLADVKDRIGDIDWDIKYCSCCDRRGEDDSFTGEPEDCNNCKSGKCGDVHTPGNEGEETGPSRYHYYR